MGFKVALLILSMCFFSPTKGVLNNLASCKTETPSSNSSGCVSSVSSSGQMFRRASTQCLVGTLKLSEDSKQYLFYVKPEKNFRFIQINPLGSDGEMLSETPIKISRRELTKSTWYPLLLDVVSSTHQAQYRLQVKDFERSGSTKWIPEAKTIISFAIVASGSFSWTYQCDPNALASLDPGHTNEAIVVEEDWDADMQMIIIATGGVAALIIIMLLTIIIVQNRRSSRISTGTLTPEVTSTLTFEFPIRPAPPVPNQSRSNTFDVSPYAVVCDALEHIYEEVDNPLAIVVPDQHLYSGNRKYFGGPKENVESSWRHTGNCKSSDGPARNGEPISEEEWQSSNHEARNSL